jgi:hypothetical protein
MDEPPLISVAEFALAHQLEALICDKSAIGTASARGGSRRSCAERKSLSH